MAISAVSSDEHPVIYLVRLVAYGLIIFGIVDKNRKKSPSLIKHDERVQNLGP
jgi:hypothetical protein